MKHAFSRVKRKILTLLTHLLANVLSTFVEWGVTHGLIEIDTQTVTMDGNVTRYLITSVGHDRPKSFVVYQRRNKHYGKE